jgi:hypothetical protein
MQSADNDRPSLTAPIAPKSLFTMQTKNSSERTASPRQRHAVPQNQGFGSQSNDMWAPDR